MFGTIPSSSTPRKENEMKIWNLVYTRIDTDNPLDVVTRVENFTSEREAQDELVAQYEAMLTDIENGSTSLDCVKREYYGTNATIQLGITPELDWDDIPPVVETQHQWRIASQAIDLA